MKLTLEEMIMLSLCMEAKNESSKDGLCFKASNAYDNNKWSRMNFHLVLDNLIHLNYINEEDLSVTVRGAKVYYDSLSSLKSLMGLSNAA